MTSEMADLVLADTDEKMAKAVAHARADFAIDPHRPGRPGAGREDPGRLLRRRAPAAAARRLPGPRGPSAAHHALRQGRDGGHREGDPAVRPRAQPQQRRHLDPPHLPAAHPGAPQGAREGRQAHGRGGQGRPAQPAPRDPPRARASSRRTATSRRTSSSGPRRSSTSSSTPTRPRSTRPSGPRKPSCWRTDGLRQALSTIRARAATSRPKACGSSPPTSWRRPSSGPRSRGVGHPTSPRYGDRPAGAVPPTSRPPSASRCRQRRPVGHRAAASGSGRPAEGRGLRRPDAVATDARAARRRGDPGQPGRATPTARS